MKLCVKNCRLAAIGECGPLAVEISARRPERNQCDFYSRAGRSHLLPATSSFDLADLLDSLRFGPYSRLVCSSDGMPKQVECGLVDCKQYTPPSDL